MSLNEPDIQAEIAGTRRRRGLTSRGRWFLLGIAIAIVLGIGIVLSVAQTGWGRAQILAYTVRAAEGRLNGVLAVEGGLRGNLLTGARFYGVRLVDDQGAPLFVADSIFIRYRVATFLGGDIVINRLDVYAGDVDIFRLPGDTLWNYQRVLQDTTSAAAAGDPRAILIERVLVYDTHVTISAPVEGDPRFTPERRQRELERMLADTARYVLEELPGGYLQHNTVEIERAEVSELYIGGEERGGTYVELVDAVGEVRLWREPPLEVRGGNAAVHVHDGVVGYRAGLLELPNSRAESVGSIDISGDRPLFDVYVRSEQFAVSDLQWLYPWLPADPDAATGSIELWVEDREEGLVVLARDLDLRMPDTHVVGNFGLITDPVAETIRFVDVDLEADPLRVESVEALLPEDLPVEGLVIGGATIRGES